MLGYYLPILIMTGISPAGLQNTRPHSYLLRPVSSASLDFFRIIFGSMTAFALIRFWWNGWIEEQFTLPSFHFHYYGFEWINYPGKSAIYGLFLCSAISAILVACGLFYRLSIIVFTSTFIYLELIDKANYLNHYYLISLIGIMMIFLPMTGYYALDVKWKISRPISSIPYWMVFALIIQVGMVYFFGGIGKIKSDWLLHAQPLGLWLEAKSDIFPVGQIFKYSQIAYIASWASMLFDISIAFLLFYKNTRWVAFGVALIFHLLTAFLFNIGMFPLFMSGFILIFFSSEFHQRILSKFLGERTESGGERISYMYYPTRCLIGLLILIQLILPFRYLLYPRNVLWHEQGYRFGWNIMLMEKVGSVEFKIKDKINGHTWVELPAKYLTAFQLRQMNTQPDMILELAHHIGDVLERKMHHPIEVKAEAYASLNGGVHKLLIDSSVNLMDIKDGIRNQVYITHE